MSVTNNSPAPRPAPGPNPGLGGMNLNALAGAARGETDRRIAGQSGLIGAYLDQVLGMNSAKNAASSERDQRMLAFERQQALLQEQMQRERGNQEAVLQQARLGSQASEGNADRAHSAAMNQSRRDFELGQASMQQPGERETLENRLLEMQVRQMEQELNPPRQTFGRGVVAADRGDALSAGRQDELRRKTFVENTGGGGITLPNIGLGGGGNLRLGGSPERTETTTYDDLQQGARGLLSSYGQHTATPNPDMLTQKLLDLTRNQPQLASLLLSDLGYYNAAPPA